MRELNEISGTVVDHAYRIHRSLGPGLLETVYEVVLADSLRDCGLAVERQVPIRIHYEGKIFEEAFRADLLVEQRIIVEIKSVEFLARVHKKQLLTYLRLAEKPLGLLINFGGEFLKGNVERVAAQPVPDLKTGHTEFTERTEE